MLNKLVRSIDAKDKHRDADEAGRLISNVVECISKQ